MKYKSEIEDGMRVLYTVCSACGKQIVWKSRASKYCETCRENNRIRKMMLRIKKFEENLAEFRGGMGEYGQREEDSK